MEKIFFFNNNELYFNIKKTTRKKHRKLFDRIIDIHENKDILFKIIDFFCMDR